MIEPLPYLKADDGRAVLDPSTERLVRVVAIASGLGASSAFTWLKVPAAPLVAFITACRLPAVGAGPLDITVREKPVTFRAVTLLDNCGVNEVLPEQRGDDLAGPVVVRRVVGHPEVIEFHTHP